MPRRIFLTLTMLYSLLNSANGDVTLSLETIATDLNQPVFVTHAGDGSGRLFIVLRTGRVLVLVNGNLLTAPFLDISGRLSDGQTSIPGEMGLLGLAFHPQFATNGRFFVNYATDFGDRRSVISEFRVSAQNPDRAGSAEKPILSFSQPFRNHNAGMLAFGRDGLLYIATGDGGQGGDPLGNGQDRSTLLGNILRIDVDRGDPYAIPADNPFVGVDNIREEIWAFGFRNPWRFSFDRFTGQLYAGDVGQQRWEEIDLVEKGGNYGWKIMEGNHCFSPESDCDKVGLKLPIAEYSRAEGNSVTGGYVYRGKQQTDLWGSYIFGDFGSGRIWALTPQGNNQWKRVLLLDSDLSISSFGEDEDGGLYVVDFGNFNEARGSILRLNFGWRELFSQFSDGITPAGSLRSTIVIINRSAGPISGTIQLVSADQGQTDLNGVPDSQFPFQLEAGSSASFASSGSTVPTFVGWAEITASGPFSSAILFSFQNTSGEIVSEAGLGPSEPALEHRAHIFAVSSTGESVGFALANPESTSAQVTITLRSGGLMIGEQAIELPGRGQIAAFLEERFPDLPPNIEATAVISSNSNLVVSFLRTKRGLPLSSLPLAPR